MSASSCSNAAAAGSPACPRHDGLMTDALVSLLGAVVGGVLVLLGDGVRRRSEGREARRRQLFDAAVALAATYNRISGALIDSHDRRQSRTEALLPSIERYEIQTRFWSTPGCAALSLEASRLSMSWTALAERYEDATGWEGARTAHARALRGFESAIRREMGDTRPLPDDRSFPVTPST
jgi:hypothetical protein